MADPKSCGESTMWKWLGWILAGVSLVAVLVLSVHVRPLSEWRSLACRKRYRSRCILRVWDPPTARIYLDVEDEDLQISPKAVAGEMLRFDSVVAALAGSSLLNEAESDPGSRERLEERLYRRIVDNTQVEHFGGPLFKATYVADTPGEAEEVLRRLVNSYAEGALARSKAAASAALQLATRDLESAEQKLEMTEMQLRTFQEQFPDVLGPPPAHAMSDLRDRIGALDRATQRRRRELDAVNKALGDGERDEEADPAADTPFRTELLLRRVVLEAELESDAEERQDLLRRGRGLQETRQALPGLLSELRRLQREKRRAEGQYEDALRRFNRVEEVLMLRTELCPVVIVVPPRVSARRTR